MKAQEDSLLLSLSSLDSSLKQKDDIILSKNDAINKLSASITSLKQQEDSFSVKLSDLNKEADSLTDKIAHLKEDYGRAVLDLSAIEMRIEMRKTAAADLDNTIARKKTDLTSLENRSDIKRAELDDTLRKSAAITRSHEAREESIKKREDALADAERRSSNIQKSLLDAHDAKDKKILALQSELGAANTKADALSRQVTDTLARLNAGEKMLQAASADIAEKSATIATLKSLLDSERQKSQLTESALERTKADAITAVDSLRNEALKHVSALEKVSKEKDEELKACKEQNTLLISALKETKDRESELTSILQSVNHTQHPPHDQPQPNTETVTQVQSDNDPPTPDLTTIINVDSDDVGEKEKKPAKPDPQEDVENNDRKKRKKVYETRKMILRDGAKIISEEKKKRGVLKDRDKDKNSKKKKTKNDADAPPDTPHTPRRVKETTPNNGHFLTEKKQF